MSKTRKLTDRDIIIKTPSGLYLVILENGKIGITNKKHASHFSRQTKAKRVVRKSGYDGLVEIHLNKKEKENK